MNPQEMVPKVQRPTGECNCCMEIKIPCTWNNNQSACIPCHQMHQTCTGMPLQQVHKKALWNQNMVEKTPHNLEPTAIAAIHTKLDKISTQLEVLQTPFDWQHTLDTKQWDTIWPVMQSMHPTLPPPFKEDDEGLQTAPPLPGHMMQWQSLNNLNENDPKQCQVEAS